MNLKRNTVTALRNVLRQYSTIRSSWEILYHYFEEIQPTSLMLQKYDGYWTPRIMSTKSGNSKRRNPNKVRTHFSRIRNKELALEKSNNVWSRWNILKNCWWLCLEQHHPAQIILLHTKIQILWRTWIITSIVIAIIITITIHIILIIYEHTPHYRNHHNHHHQI